MVPPTRSSKLDGTQRPANAETEAPGSAAAFNSGHGKLTLLIDSRWPMAELPAAMTRSKMAGLPGAIIMQNP